MTRLALLPLFVLSVLACGVSQAANVVWLETEHFRDLGGWTQDAQFVDQMGSPFLLAIGLHGPVKDAVTTASIPAGGKYRLWVRARDWVPEHSPGKFQVVLGGRVDPRVFGQTKAKGWVWEQGGEHELAAGKLEVRLRDLTGHYGRCDAIVLSDDPTYRPSEDRAGLVAARIQGGGLSREVKRQGPYDTVVVGGGLAGTMAAIASARTGAKTALVQDRPVLGGNGSTEVLVNPEGDTTREPLDPGETGIIEEFRGNVDGYSERMLKLCRGQKNLDLYLNVHATGVEMKDAAVIAAVEGLEVTTGQRMSFPAAVVVDCTGDGAIGVWAGAEYRHGREPRSMYKETRAPEQGDDFKGTMGGTLRYATEASLEPVVFQAPAWARHFPRCSDFHEGRHPQLRIGGWQWVIEYGGDRNTYDDAEEIRDELLRIIWGMWDHAANHCPKLAEEAKKVKLVWVSHVVGKRESRRLIGDYVMTEHDIGNQALFADRVSYGGWGVDLHPPAGFYDPGPPAIFSHKVKFSVPFRSLYSKNVSNLLMAGRDISVSHVALGATRVMITCGLQGQAAGTAAALCKAHQVMPRELGQSYVPELQQQLLKDGCYLIDLPNRDARDLALGAKVTASSFSPPVEIEKFGKALVHPMTCDRAVMFRVTSDRIDSIAAHLESSKDQPVQVQLGLRVAAALGDFSADKDVASARATVPPKGSTWVEFPLRVRVKPGLYYAWIAAAPAVGWRLFESPPADTFRAYRQSGGWKGMAESYRFRLTPPGGSEAKPSLARQMATMFAPENMVDGLARAVRGWPSSWRPDPKLPLPQWIELDFGREVPFNAVHVSFQTKQLRADDFRVEVLRDGAWQTIVDVRGNGERRCVLRFDRTTSSRLRLVLTKLQADAAVCEVRVYDEP